MSFGTLNADTITNSNGLSGNAIGPGFKNRIINGDMRTDQRNAGAAVTANGAFPVDRFPVGNNTDGAFSAQQDSSAPLGFVNSLKITTTTADGTLATTQNLNLIQRIEGTNLSDLGWGTANAKTVTLSFWVRSSLTGTFGGALRNAAANRSYPYTYTISVADTWEYKTVTIPGDTSGTWLTTTGIGLNVFFGLGTGPDLSGTAGAWNSNNNVSATGATSVIGTLNATWFITGVQLEVGPSATSFDYRPYGTQLALCQRYYYKIFPAAVSRSLGQCYSTSTTGAQGFGTYPVTMRTRPTALEQSGTANQYGVVNGSASTAQCNSVPTFGTQTTSDAWVADFYVASGLTTGQGGQLRTDATNGASAYLAWSAEL